MIQPRKHLLQVERDVQCFYTRDGISRLDMNEYLPYASSCLYEELIQRLQPEIISSYPMVNEAYRAVSRLINQPEDKIVLTAGSDGVIYSTLMAFCNSGDEIGYVEPTYGMYAVYAALMNLRVNSFQYDLYHPLDRDKILDSIRPEMKVFLLANPNGVIGDELEYDFILQLVEKGNKTGTIILIDEVYAAFQDNGNSRFTALTERYNNLVIARSFSKSYGLAGIRAGYSISHVDTRKILLTVRSNVELNSIAVEAIKIWCNHPQELQSSIKEIVEAKKMICGELKKNNNLFIEGKGNFILVKVEEEKQWKEKFSHENIAVKWLELEGQKWIRVTVGTFSYMQRFLDVILKR